VRHADLDDPVQKAQVASDLLPVIAKIDSSLIRDHYLSRLARLLRAEERTLAREMVALMGKPGRPKRRGPTTTQTPQSPPPVPPWDEGWGSVPGGPWENDPGYLDEWSGEFPPDPALQVTAPDDAAESQGELQGELQGANPTELEAYLLYLMIERPSLMDEAVQQGVRADTWQQTEHRQLWEAMLQHRPKSVSQLEEFSEALEAPVARQLRRIMLYYGGAPRITAEEWEDEGFTTLSNFLIRYDERQALQLHYLLDDMQRTLEPEPDAMRVLLQQKQQFERSKLQRQRALHERNRQRKIAEPNRP
jgi:hypothetical protein